ncbi:ABC transporter permease [Propionimicrobium sp. PCR01-08-3]|uniref:ABC transporter permease n=1 Tax=Propionimicrobium sp. PCR01-08-3 TaxID=3052086 RepID=UPI00255CBE81|nr:ABC transporter permease [Propionimicrobium sp. PCR01-08-3]WIY82332.1 ABC transporter permease [Propionimicrobium sp. PCR01-08-3]
MIGRLFAHREALLGVVLVVIMVLFGVANPSFFSAAHLFGVARSAVVLGIMALGVMTVLVTNGIDISVPAIEVVSMYLTTVTLNAINFQGTVLLAIAVGCLIGAVLGLVNGILVAWLRLPAMIVTIGTLTLYRGGLLAFVGTERIRVLPAQMSEFGQLSLFSVNSGGRIASLSVTVLIWALLAVGLALLLKRTWWGRYLYAIGDNEEAAERLGVKINRTRISAFVLSGLLAGLGGIFYASMNRAADPSTLIGFEMSVLAAVVLGGANVTGGRGTVTGTVLGVLLITVVGNSLVLVGIPSAWQQVFVGGFLLIGVVMPAFRDRRERIKRGKVVDD